MKFTGLIRKFIIGAAIVLAPAASYAGIFVSVRFAPPELPVYTQPICPGDGYLWNPGYWAYGDEGYYWVPGVWVEPPTVGLLWTPGYWGYNNGLYVFNAGYWGPHVGFYGGVNYGFGFGGFGFSGGEWRGGHFAYNTAYSNVNRTVIHNTYINRTTINNTTINNSHTSFNGGQGGIQARPNAEEARYEHENHVAPTSAQQSHLQAAHSNPANFAKANGGHPAMAAIQRPGATNTAVAARGAAAGARPGNQGVSNAHPTGQQSNQRQNTGAQRPATNASQPTRTGGFGQTAQHSTQPQTRTQPQARPETQARPQTQAARPQAQQARPQAQQARPQAQQARPQAAPRAQAAPHAENHGGEHGHR